MVKIRYTSWDGSQRVRLNADQVFEKLSEYLSYTDDVQQALEWLLRQGMEWEGMRIMGLDDLLDELREELRKLYRQFNLNNAFDDPRRRLEELLDLERDALADSEPADAQQRRDSLDRLPHRLSEAIEALKSYDFVDGDARREFENLLEELDNVRDLENFERQYGDLFHGPESPGYAEALDLMREMQRLKQIEEELLSGDLERIDLERLREILGQRAAQDFQTLREVMAMLDRQGLEVERYARHFRGEAP